MFVPIIYRFDPLTFRPRPGFGCVYEYVLQGKSYIGITTRKLRVRHREHLRMNSVPAECASRFDVALNREPVLPRILLTCKQGLLQMEEDRLILQKGAYINGWNDVLNDGRVVSPYVRERMAKAKIGTHPSEETRAKLRESQKRAHADPDYRRRQSEAGKGRKWSEETRVKMETSLVVPKQTKKVAEKRRRTILERYGEYQGPPKGRTFSDKSRKKMSDAKMGKSASWNNCPVVRLDCAGNVVEWYDSMKSVTTSRRLGEAIRSNRIYNGFYWAFANSI